MPKPRFSYCTRPRQTTLGAVGSRVPWVRVHDRKRVFCQFLLIWCCVWGAWAQNGDNSQLVLTNAAQIRALSLEEAGRKYPVRIRGVVTHYDRRWSLSVQDKTAGIYIWTEGKAFDLGMGQSVEVEGVTGP